MTTDELIKYINSKIEDINKIFPNLISNEQKENYIKTSIRVNMKPDEIQEKVEEIDELYEEIIQHQYRLLDARKELARQYQKKKDELNSMVNEMNKKDVQVNLITNSAELNHLLSDIEFMSLLSSKEALDFYSQNKQYEHYIQQVNRDNMQQIIHIKEERKNNQQLSDIEFYKKMMIQFLNPVINKISEEYKDDLPVEKMQKVFGLLNADNIVFSLDKNLSDIQANSETGKLIINPEKTKGATIEEKIVSSMGIATHEIFHLMINMLKTPEQAEKLGERLMYKVATSEGEKELHFAPGKYGQVLSEGFVEKISSEFAQKNGFYHTINPSYIPYVNLCTFIQNQSPSIDNKFLFTKNADDVIAKMTPSAKTSFESAERLAVFNNFEVKEIKKDERLRGIKSDNVVSSWMEKNDEIVSEKKNDKFQKSFTLHNENLSLENEPTKVESFTQRSQTEIQIYQQIKQKNQMIKKQKESQQLNKPQVRTLIQNSSNNSTQSNGFVNVIILSIVVAFVCSVLFLITYGLIKG